MFTSFAATLDATSFSGASSSSLYGGGHSRISLQRVHFLNLPSIIGRIRTSYLDPLSEWLVRRATDPHETPDPLDDFEEDDK